VSLFSPTPIVSVVVPFSGNEAAFESTLVSVLENRPRLCEIIVAHDGSYSDPFELEDEVRFVIGSGADLPALIRAGADQARGRILHVLAEGCCATEGWLDKVLEISADADFGMLAPASLASRTADRLTTLGWVDGARGFCSPVATGQAVTSLPRQLDISGPILQASFWETDLVQSLASLPTGRDPLLTQYAWASVAKQAGYTCQAAPHCRVVEGRPGLGYEAPSRFTARHLQAVRSAVTETNAVAAIAGSLLQGLGNAHRPRHYRETIGRCLAALLPTSYGSRFTQGMRSVLHALQTRAARTPETETLRFPNRTQDYRSDAWVPQRRAA